MEAKVSHMVSSSQAVETAELERPKTALGSWNE